MPATSSSSSLDNDGSHSSSRALYRRSYSSRFNFDPRCARFVDRILGQLPEWLKAEALAFISRERAVHCDHAVPMSGSRQVRPTMGYVCRHLEKTPIALPAGESRMRPVEAGVCRGIESP
jgi:hypothetical protein